MRKRSYLSIVAVMWLLALLPVPGRAGPMAFPPVWESRVRMQNGSTDQGQIWPGLRNRASVPGEQFPFVIRAYAPNGAQHSVDLVAVEGNWTEKKYPSDFPGAPGLMPGNYRFEFIQFIRDVGATVVRQESVTLSGHSSTSANEICAGDEQMSFSPGNPVEGQEVNITVTSSRPSADVKLDGPSGISFQGAGPGGKGTNWRYKVRIETNGRYDFNFKVRDAVCTSNFVDVGYRGTGSNVTTGGSNWEVSAPQGVVLAMNGNYPITIRNRNGRSGERYEVRVTVGMANGQSYEKTVNVDGTDLVRLNYPASFTGAPSLLNSAGQHHIEWRIVGRNEVYRSTVLVKL